MYMQSVNLKNEFLGKFKSIACNQNCMSILSSVTEKGPIELAVWEKAQSFTTLTDLLVTSVIQTCMATDDAQIHSLVPFTLMMS